MADTVTAADAETTIKFLACEWWRGRMTSSVEEVIIHRDGRVSVRWKDKDDGGVFTLPVDFMSQAIARHRTQSDDLREALSALVVAVCYADPPTEFNGVLCHEARVPVEFVEHARKALGPKRKP